MDELAMVVLAMSVLLVRVGGVLLACGSGRARFAATAAWRCVLEGAVLAVGLTLAVGVMRAAGWSDEVRLLTVLSAALLGSAVLSAASGERTRTRWTVVLALVYGAGVVPALWVIHPFMPPEAVRWDAAGVMAMAMTAGWVSLVGAMLAGPRAGRFHRDGAISLIPPHQQPMVVVGLMVLWAGWAGGWSVLSGEDAGVGVEPWLLAPAGAVLSAAGYGRWRFGRVDVGLLVPGLVGGVLAGAMLVGPVAGMGGGAVSVAVGLGAGWVSAWAHLALERKLGLDDVTGAVAGLVVGPLVGGLVAATVGGGWRDGFGQLFAAAAYVGVAVGLTAAVMAGVRTVTPVRIDEAAEYEGLDLASLDLNAYPDFQQPMIRSSHLREV